MHVGRCTTLLLLLTLLLLSLYWLLLTPQRRNAATFRANFVFRELRGEPLVSTPPSAVLHHIGLFLNRLKGQLCLAAAFQRFGVQAIAKRSVGCRTLCAGSTTVAASI